MIYGGKKDKVGVFFCLFFKLFIYPGLFTWVSIAASFHQWSSPWLYNVTCLGAFFGISKMIYIKLLGNLSI